MKKTKNKKTRSHAERGNEFHVYQDKTFPPSSFILPPSAFHFHPSKYALLTSAAIISNPRFTVASS